MSYLRWSSGEFKALRAVAIAGLLLISSEAVALSYEGQVTHISDADTVRVTVTETCDGSGCPDVGDSITVRLAEIDAPERGQPYGGQATALLAGVLSEQPVTVEQTGMDRYGRAIGQLTHQGTWINGWLVGQGAAWVYPQYAESPQLFELESAARRAKRGLWGEDSPIEPWEWRRR